MTRADFEEMVRSKVTDYERMQIANAIERVPQDDGRAFTALGGVMFHKDAKAVLQVLDLAAKVVPAGPIGSDAIQAAVTHAFPAEAMQLLADAMRLR